MMNKDRNDAVESIARAWAVETTDLSDRIAAVIGAQSAGGDPMLEVLREVQALRREMESFRQANAQLYLEVTRLRQDLSSRKAVRIAPYAPIDNLVRLS